MYCCRMISVGPSSDYRPGYPNETQLIGELSDDSWIVVDHRRMQSALRVGNGWANGRGTLWGASRSREFKKEKVLPTPA